MNDEETSRVLEMLVDPHGPAVIRIGNLPIGCLEHWTSRVSDDVVITRRQRHHYLENHPEMKDFERDLGRTLLDPEAVFALMDDQHTALLCSRQDHFHDIIAVVSISISCPLHNSVITARRQRRTRRGKPSHRNLLVWQR